MLFREHQCLIYLRLLCNPFHYHQKLSLYKKVEQISSGLLDKFKSLTLGEINMGNLKNNIIDSTKTIFTTPQITFNVQKLGESELQQCFNYINRKFGSQY